MFIKFLMSVGAVSLALFIGMGTASTGMSEMFGKEEFADRYVNVYELKEDSDPIKTEHPDVVIAYETETEEIGFETVYIPDPTLVYGKQEIKTQGENGRIVYTYETLTSGGKQLSRKLVSEITDKEPINQVVHYGNDPTTPYGEMISPTLGKLTSCYGYRPGVGASNYHYGIDIAWRRGTEVVAADGGVVTVRKSIESFGLYLCIDHGNGLVTLYSHLDSATVKVGQRVARGELIGYMGDSGNATAPCLHFEVRLNGKRIDPLDGYLDKKDIVTPD